MANREHLDILKRGVREWNPWRDQHPDIEPDLGGAPLSHALLHNVNLSGANLRKTILHNANLNHAHLASANLSGADLRGTDLWAANLSRADLSKVVLNETTFSNANLTAVRGLETCDFHAPNTLDHRTFAKSGPLPLTFLRGCGLRDWEIEVTKLYDLRLTSGQVTDILYRIHHLRTDPLIQFYSCFISYNHTDAVFARRLYDQLQDRGIRCWLDEHQMLPGDDIYNQWC